jgi:hypothetical protein
MRMEATKETSTPPLSQLLSFSTRCRAIMVFAAKWWLILFVISLSAPVFGLDLAPVNYMVLNFFIGLFVVAATGRVYCCAGYVITGIDVRTKDEQYFVPANVSNGVAQRLYTAVRLMQTDSFLTILACSMLVLLNSAANMASTPFFIASQSLLLAFCALTAVCLATRALLLHLHTAGWLVIYDPGERLHTTVSKPQETDAHVSTGSATVMRVLMLTRRIPMLAAMMMIPVFIAGSILRTLLSLQWVAVWTEYACLGLVALAVLYVVARFILVATVFVRYSIIHILGTQLLLGFLVSITMTTPNGWNLIPFFATVLISVLVLVFIAAQDPEGEKQVPEFIKARRREQRRQRRELQKKLQAQKPMEKSDKLNHGGFPAVNLSGVHD